MRLRQWSPIYSTYFRPFQRIGFVGNSIYRWHMYGTRITNEQPIVVSSWPFGECIYIWYGWLSLNAIFAACCLQDFLSSYLHTSRIDVCVWMCPCVVCVSVKEYGNPTNDLRTIDMERERGRETQRRRWRQNHYASSARLLSSESLEYRSCADETCVSYAPYLAVVVSMHQRHLGVALLKWTGKPPRCRLSFHWSKLPNNFHE